MRLGLREEPSGAGLRRDRAQTGYCDRRIHAAELGYLAGMDRRGRMGIVSRRDRQREIEEARELLKRWKARDWAEDEARRAKKLSQAQVASLAGVGQADVSDIERGAANPTLNRLEAVATAIGMEIAFVKRSSPKAHAVRRSSRRQVRAG